MASITTKTVTVQKPSTEEQVVLTLTKKEAEALRYLTYNLGGDRNGPRGLFDEIGTALADAGVSPKVSTALDISPRFPAEPLSFRPGSLRSW